MKDISVFFTVKFMAFSVGLISCFLLHQTFSLPSVLSAAIIGFAGSFIPKYQFVNSHPRAAVYAGAFAGMCTSDVIKNVNELLFVSAMGALLYTAMRQHLNGVGGKLGAIAFSAVALLLLLKGVAS
jgi:uncharacterized membrane protein YjjP (DUF1212 family)